MATRENAEHAANGFQKPTTTPAPDTLFDYWLPRVSGAQLRVLLFLIRRCYSPDGQLVRDAVAASGPRFLQGGRFPDSHRFDGCGIRTKTTLKEAAAGLEALGLVHKDRTIAPHGGDGTSVYRLCVRDHPDTPAAAGFRPLNTTPIPNELYDYWLARLGDAELRALLYIVRHTLGWRKAQDVISLEQFITGIRSRDGRIVDEGCGVKTPKHLYLALAALEKHTLIRRTRRRRPDGGDQTTSYSLFFAGDVPHILRPSARATPEELGVGGAPDNQMAEDNAPSPAASPARTDQIGGIVATGRGAQARPDRGSKHSQRGGPDATTRGAQPRPVRADACDRPGRPVTTGQQETRSQETDSQEMQHQQHGPRTRHATREGSQRGVGVVHDTRIVPPEEAVRPAQGAPVTTYSTQLQAHDSPDADGALPRTNPGDDQATVDAEAEPLILETKDEIRNYALADDQVLLDAGGGRVQIMTLRALVCNDIRATESSPLPVWTEPYYSVEHYLGEGGDEWTLDEERKIARHRALHDELDAVYRNLGAFSLEEALGQYFTADLVRRYVGGSPSERERVRGWLRYVRGDAGASLTNPAGFLRTCLESTQWAPNGVAPGTGWGRQRRR